MASRTEKLRIAVDCGVLLCRYFRTPTCYGGSCFRQFGMHEWKASLSASLAIVLNLGCSVCSSDADVIWTPVTPTQPG